MPPSHLSKRESTGGTTRHSTVKVPYLKHPTPAKIKWSIPHKLPWYTAYTSIAKRQTGQVQLAQCGIQRRLQALRCLEASKNSEESEAEQPQSQHLRTLRTKEVVSLEDVDRMHDGSESVDGKTCEYPWSPLSDHEGTSPPGDRNVHRWHSSQETWLPWSQTAAGEDERRT